LRVIGDDGSLRYIPTFGEWRKRIKNLVVLHDERASQHNKTIKLEREVIQFEREKALTTGRAWIPLNGSTR
jgi:hypothetical protein